MTVTFRRSNAWIYTRSQVNNGTFARPQLGADLHQDSRRSIPVQLLLPQPAQDSRAIRCRGSTVDDQQFLLRPFEILADLTRFPGECLIEVGTQTSTRTTRPTSGSCWHQDGLSLGISVAMHRPADAMKPGGGRAAFGGYPPRVSGGLVP